MPITREPVIEIDAVQEHCRHEIETLKAIARFDKKAEYKLALQEALEIGVGKDKP